MTSNARLFHSVSRGSDVSVMPAFFARFAISSTLPDHSPFFSAPEALVAHLTSFSDAAIRSQAAITVVS